jgi:molybdate transport system substrate-binding protein
MRYLALLLTLVTCAASGAEPIRVAVAANFKSTLSQISDQFQRDTGYQVVLSSGSTGALYSQIIHGAPFDLFFAADRDAAARLHADRRGGTPFCYASGELVLAGGNGELAQLADPRLSLAIANPVTAPYGTAAMTVLARAEFAGGQGRKLVRGTNVVQALQFWRSGATDLALLPKVLAPTATAIPDQWYPPIEQHAIVLRVQDGPPAIDAYLNWIRSDRVRALITDAGYRPCP